MRILRNYIYIPSKPPFGKGRLRCFFVPAGQTPLTPEETAAKAAELERAGLLIEEWSAADVNAAPERVGFAGSPTKVKQVMSVVLTASEAKQIEPTEAGINELIHELISDHTLG